MAGGGAAGVQRRAPPRDAVDVVRGGGADREAGAVAHGDVVHRVRGEIVGLDYLRISN